jgi:hypothetical protein
MTMNERICQMCMHRLSFSSLLFNRCVTSLAYMYTYITLFPACTSNPRSSSNLAASIWFSLAAIIKAVSPSYQGIETKRGVNCMHGEYMLGKLS